MPEAKRRVQDAAIKSFSKCGRAGARIDEIVRLSKVNVRMIYHYFGSKDGLYDDILAEVFRSRAEFLRRVKMESGDWDRLAVIKGMMDWQASEPELSRILDWEACDDWAGSSAALEAEAEAPSDLAPEGHQGGPRDCFRLLHSLTSYWVRWSIADLEVSQALRSAISALTGSTEECFASDRP